MSHSPQCRICHSNITSFYSVKEMMYGLQGIFNYHLCKECHCLQLSDVPANLSDYYPKNYYSYSNSLKKRPFKNWQRSLKRRIILQHSSIFSSLFSFLIQSQSMFWTYRKLGIRKQATVLDVGSGSGSHVLELRSAKIDALGIDPFIEQDIMINDALLVKKGALNDLDKKFDLICFHHSFEHIVEQLKTLLHAKERLKSGGKILIRIPTTSSWAFDEYQEHWVQLDAPRHIFLHSHESIKLLAKQAGLIVKDIWCDSSEFQFIGSEQYKKGITLLDPKSYYVNKKTSIFSKAAIKQFQIKAHQANESLKGDQICVVLEIQP